jgi:glutamine cyclotransferase
MAPAGRRWFVFSAACTGLMPASRRVNAESVLNGIAYDAQHDRLFVTGKQWPTVFEIRIAPAARREGR